MNDSQLALYEQIVERTSEGVWVIDAASVTTFVNQSMADMLGYSREDLVGRPMFELMDDEGRRTATANVERRRQGISESHEFVFVRRDGSRLWSRLTTNVLHDAAGAYSGALALVTDLTAERQGAAERERLQEILDDSLNEIYMFRARDLRFEYANRGALANLGFSLDELRELTPLDIKPEHDHASFRALLQPLVDRHKARLSSVTLHRRKDGSTYPVEVHVQLVTGAGAEPAFLAIIDDITERRAAEHALRAAEARSLALLEHSLDLVVLADTAGKLVFASPSVFAILGYRPAEFLALDPIELVHPEDREAAATTFARALAGTAADVERVEFRMRHRDGSWRVLASRSRNLLADPDVGALVLTSRDVTPERRLEEQLQQSQRLESVGRLAGGVAHDFNNILTAILVCASFLVDSPRLTEAERRDVEEIKRAGERATQVTSQLLAFARRQVIRPRSLSLATIVAEQQRFLSRVLGEQIELVTELAADLWPIHADPTQLEQVIVNLAVNARDAMRDGGRLTIEATNVMLDASFAALHAEVEPGAYVMLAVSDTGKGIPADVLPHVFEPFFTTKAVGAGSGLGLATVYGIVRQVDGHIWVYSEPGTGTTFKICFRRAATPAVSAGELVGPTADGGSERLLVVEDDDVVRRVLVRALATAGYSVHAEPTPADGLAWARAHRGEFELLITDVVMPGMNGKQLAAALTAEIPGLRVLFVSGYTENTVVHRGVVDSGVAFLSKPFAPSELRARVRALLDRVP